MANFTLAGDRVENDSRKQLHWHGLQNGRVCGCRRCRRATAAGSQNMNVFFETLELY
jgi:hypothetical protein